jgi:phosphoserine phosphatase RsbU/P
MGSSWAGLQGVLVLIGISSWILFRLVEVKTHFVGSLIFTLVVGNWSSALLNVGHSLYSSRRPPWNWLIYVLLILGVGASGSVLGDMAAKLVLFGPHANFLQHPAADVPVGTLITLIIAVVFQLFSGQKSALENRNRELQRQVQLGDRKEQSHEAELAQAHEIQRHLLPQETPQIAGFQIACAWQPAKAVSGDYFDVLTLGPGRLGLCIADVSGKGITAALLMANLQASVKAFSPEAESPATLCAKLNSVLCETVAPGKFVTLFYGIIDTQQRKLQYENCGHCLPLLVHADGSILMPASYSGVLGLFSHWTYQNSELQLQSGDCLVLTTDGVLEAANENEEEFGYQRLIDAVKKSTGSGSHGVRTAILEAVSAYCAGKFDDDASLIVVKVE